MVSDTIHVLIQVLLTRPLLTMRQREHLLEPSARDLVIDYIVTHPAIDDNDCEHLVFRLPGCIYKTIQLKYCPIQRQASSHKY
jgi:hypothetical protein